MLQIEEMGNGKKELSQQSILFRKWFFALYNSVFIAMLITFLLLLLLFQLGYRTKNYYFQRRDVSESLNFVLL